MIVKICCVLLSAIVAINAQNLEDNDEEKTCYTESGMEGECVPYFLCQNGTIITDGSGILGIRTDFKCINYFEECCEENKKHVRTFELTRSNAGSNS